MEYGTWNLYAYCAGNPVSYVDPSGHAWYNKVVKGVKKAVNGVKKTAKKVAGTVKKAVKKAVSTIKKTTGKMSGIVCDALDIAVQVLDLTSDMAKKMSAISAVSALISSQLEGLVVSAGGEAIAYAGTAYLTMECAEIFVAAALVGAGSNIVSNKIKKLKNNIKKKGKSGKKTLLQSTPEEIANMTRKELQDSIPEGWDFQNHNGRIHIKDENGNYRVRIDPPDKKTNYTHIHIMDENKNPLDINGNIVSPKDPSGHIPYND